MGLMKKLFGPKEGRFVEVAPFGSRYEVPSGETMLEAALKNGVPFPHNCTVGTCGSCKCKLKTGRVNALTDFGYTLSQQEIAAGFILACQAIPKDPLTQVEVESSAADAPKPETFEGRIVARESLTHDILKITIALNRPIRFVAGQYANLKYPNIRRARNYSFADAPDRDGRQQISFFIRKVPKGAFTEDLFSGALDDVPIDVDAPHGNFHLHPGTTPMICIAGGSGLAPLLSVLEDARKNRVKRPCAFLFGARTQADLYCLDQIQQLAQGWADQFVFLPVLSHEAADTSWTGARGLVTQFITDAMPGIDWSTAEGYMCGPPGMIDAGIASMTEVGMSIEKIFYDKFTDESHISKMP
ncbi:MAG TPA: 2Fe-2S iron-sulfur cluster binding domain-containing protein [Nevskiaceae bacterium]|nr:2Fe-2S iron-sulfur cluster binding domain-containing protein [Nevskiaceae bacterium]